MLGYCRLDAAPAVAASAASVQTRGHGVLVAGDLAEGRARRRDDVVRLRDVEGEVTRAALAQAADQNGPPDAFRGSGEPAKAGSMKTSAEVGEPSTKYFGSGGKSRRFGIWLPMTERGEYAKISRPVPRSNAAGEVGRVAAPDARIEGVEEAVVGAHVEHLAALGVEIGEVEVRLRRRRPRRGQVRHQVLIVLGRLDDHRLGVEDVAELVRVARRRRSVVVGAHLRRLSRSGRVVLVEVGELLLLADPRSDQTDRGGTDRRVVQDLVAAAEGRRASAQELNRQDRERLICGARGREQVHVDHQVVEAAARRTGPRARAGIGEEVSARQRNGSPRAPGKNHLAARPDVDRRGPARGRGRRRQSAGSEVRDGVRVPEHAASAPYGLAVGGVRIVRVGLVDVEAAARQWAWRRRRRRGRRRVRRTGGRRRDRRRHRRSPRGSDRWRRAGSS